MSSPLPVSDPKLAEAGVSPQASVRAGRPRDAAAVLAMLDGAVRWLVAQGRQGQWGEESFSAKADWVALVQGWASGGGLRIAELDGAPAGSLVLGAAPSSVPAVSEPEVYVQLLVTARSHAGRGIGRVLLGHARAEAAARAAALLRVDCWAGGDGALVRYYQAAGFTPTVRFTVDDWQGQVLEQRLQPSSSPSP
jgi:GNAT superfamily N-acetyltransferase